MADLIVYQPISNNKSKDKKNKKARPVVEKQKSEDTHRRLLRLSLRAKYIRRENEAAEALVSLNKKIFFVNNNLFELYKRDMEMYASSEAGVSSTGGEEDSNVIDEDECKAKLLVACRLTRAYNILQQKGGKLSPLMLKKITRKNINKTNSGFSSNELGKVLMQHKLRLCVKALYVAARMRRSQRKRERNLSLVHCYADEQAVIRRIRLTEKLARDLVSSYQNESWQPDVYDLAFDVRHSSSTPVPSAHICHKHRTFPCSYSSLLRELFKDLAAGVPVDLPELETMASPINESASQQTREMFEFGEYDASINFEMFEEGEEGKNELFDSSNLLSEIPEDKENQLARMDGESDAIEEEFADSIDEDINSYSHVRDKVDFITQADNIRMGDVFWASAEYDPPLEGAWVLDKRGRARQIPAASCLVVVFAALRHAMHPRVLAIDRYFEKNPCLREGTELLTVCPEGGLVEQALLMVQRSKYSRYVCHRGRLAYSLLLRCRPRRLPTCVALDAAGRLSSGDALSDLMALGPAHALVKWAGRPPLIPAPTLLGFGEYSTDDMVPCHLQPACFTRKCPLQIWRPILTDRTVFQPAPPSLYLQ